MGIAQPVTVERNPNRPNIFYASHARPDRGDNKLGAILDPIVSELKLMRKDMPITLIYGNLETIADCFIYFTEQMGKEQYHPPSANPVAKNRLFTQYHAQYPEDERKWIVHELVNGTSNRRVLFVTVAFGMGIDCNNIRRIVHSGVPYTMEEYCEEVGRAGRDGLQEMVDIYFNSYDTSKARKNMTDTLRSYVQSDKCKREIILKYFGYDVPDKQPKDHTCCDFHRKICQCETCQLVQAADQVEALALDVHVLSHEQDDNKTVIIASEVKENIKQDIERYRVKL